MQARKCNLDGCDRKRFGRGLCQRHYNRLRNTGTTDLSSPTICSITGCGKKHEAKGYCSPHYSQMWRTGKTPTLVTPRAQLAAYLDIANKRFLAKIKRIESGCLVWTSTTNHKGYGLFAFRGKLRSAHRHAWEMKNGPIPEGLQIDHLCRIRACVNPSHLEPVSPRENNRRGDSVTAKLGSATSCVNGHPFSGDNVRRVNGNGMRVCKTCERKRGVEYRLRLKTRKKEETE